MRKAIAARTVRLSYVTANGVSVLTDGVNGVSELRAFPDTLVAMWEVNGRGFSSRAVGIEWRSLSDLRAWESPEQFLCNTCGQSFQNAAGLAGHAAIKHPVAKTPELPPVTMQNAMQVLLEPEPDEAPEIATPVPVKVPVLRLGGKGR